ncbi:MAG: DEAD/DEAH box helicase family protein [bacterium]|nr:DEAD/DEAH box helicase family protein [bacterium]
MLQTGDRVCHRFNKALGPGVVVEADAHVIVVAFPDAEETLSFAGSTDALTPLVIAPGTRARMVDNEEEVVVDALLEGNVCRLEDGREISADLLWPLPSDASPVELLARGEIDSLPNFSNRLDAMRLERLREAGGLGSFLGGRIRIHPHQLFAAEAACQSEPVRWLLADGVGLGKTVEACLIMNALIHTGRAERTLVVAPESLTVQWLGEMWRKHHQVFALLDEARIAEVARDQGDEFNPFEVHHQAIISFELLCDDPRLARMATASHIDLLVVDEAHHLQRAVGHPGNLAYRAVAPLALETDNLLLLTATPLEDDALGFLRLVQLLRPDDLPEDDSLLDVLDQPRSLPPCTTATRATDIGGWPPRIPAPVSFDEEQWAPIGRLEAKMRSMPATNEYKLAQKARMISCSLASAPVLGSILKQKDRDTAILLANAEKADPRLEWLIEQAPSWRHRGDKTLVFVAHRESLEMIKQALEQKAHLRVGLFHEDLSVKRRDIEVAQLRLAEGPSLLVTTECGGEGRNFEMCDRLVLFDMPWHPGVIEQRIGRLDRIGRTRPTEIVYFRPPSGLAAQVVHLYEEMGLFRESLGGIDRELRHIAREIARAAVDESADIGPGFFADLLDRALEARTKVQEAAYRELHRNPYSDSMAGEILERVPAELETLIADVALRAASSFGFEVDQQSGVATWLIGLGGEALIDRLPGVPPDSSFIGTFSREEAVERETIDFFSSGHPLVEGILSELSDGSRGRTACFEISGEEETIGLFAIYRRGPILEAEAVDARGKPRPDLAAQLIEKDVRLDRVDHTQWTAMPEWDSAVFRMARRLPKGETPQAVAAFRVRTS